MKKIVAILLAMLVLSGFAVSCPAATIVSGKPIELLKNGSFEVMETDVKPMNWALEPGFTWGVEAKVEDDNAIADGKVLHVAVPSDGTKGAQFAQSLQELAPGVEYTLRFSMCGSAPSTKDVRIGFEYSVPKYSFSSHILTPTQDWKTYEYTFTPPAGVTKFNIRAVMAEGTDTKWANFSLTIPAPKNEDCITYYDGYVAPLDFYNQEPLPGAENLLLNGSFDEVPNGATLPTHWKKGHKDSAIFSVDTDAPKNGGNAIKLITKHNWTYASLGYEEPIKTINFKGEPGTFKPNTRYRVSLRSYCDGDVLPRVSADGAPILKLRTEYYVENSSTEKNPIDDGQVSSNLGPSATGIWEEHTAYFTAPENTTGVGFFIDFRTVDPGEGNEYAIWVDDIKLQQVEEESYAALHPDQVFYYAEDGVNKPYENKTGFARLRVYSEHIADCAGGSVDFKLVNAGKTETLAQKEGVSLSEDHTATFSYPLSDMEISGYQAGDETGQKPTEKPYLLIADIYNQNGELQNTVTQAIYKYRRPEKMNIDGELLDENGEIFIPTFAYSPPMASSFPKEGLHPDVLRVDMLEDLGINFPQLSTGLLLNRYTDKGHVRPTSSDALRMTLDELDKKGMKAVVTFHPGCGHGAHPNMYYRTIAAVLEYRDHPAVGAWSLMDEPWDMIVEQEYWLAEMYKLIRRYDDTHPIFFTDNSLYMEYSSMYCDMASVDAYPTHPQNSGDSLFPETDRFETCTSNPAVYAGESAAILRRTTERYGKHILQVQPSFVYHGYLPSVSDLRSFWYQTIFEDGHANGWFSIGGEDGFYMLANGKADLWNKQDASDDIPAKTQHLEWLKELGREELPMSYLLFGRSSPYVQFNKFETADYAYESVAANGDLYVLVWNRKAAVQTINASLTSQNGLVTAYGTPTELYHFYDPDVPEDTGCNPVNNNGILTVTLQPAEIGLIRIPCAVPNADILSQPSFDDVGGLVSGVKTAVEAMWRAGVMDAENRMFAPSEQMTRGAFTKALIRALDLECLSSRGQLAEQFSDVSSNAPYAREVQVARSLGILKGTGNTCSPEALISGAEAKILCERALAKAIRAFDDYGSFGTGATITKAETAVLMNKLYQLQKGEI